MFLQIQFIIWLGFEPLYELIHDRSPPDHQWPSNHVGAIGVDDLSGGGLLKTQTLASVAFLDPELFVIVVALPACDDRHAHRFMFARCPGYGSRHARTDRGERDFPIDLM